MTPAEKIAKWRAGNPDKWAAQKERTRLRKIELRKDPLFLGAQREKNRGDKAKFRETKRGRASIRLWRIRRKYGLTDPEIFQLNLVTECPLCKSPFVATILADKITTGLGRANPRSIPAVDHNHKTGKVRGVTCKICNIMLAAFDESKVTAEAFANWANKA